MSKVTQLTLDEGGGLSRKRIHLREISGEADAPLETVGQDLRAGRLRRGDDLAAVARVLKIRKDHLEALEEDRFEALPGRTYAIGFVRSYADYLGLDPVEAVERFKSEIAGRDDRPKVPLLEQPQPERRLPEGWVIVVVVLAVVFAFGAWRLFKTADTMLNAPVAPVPTRIAPPVIKPKPHPHAAVSAPVSVAAAQPAPALGPAPTPSTQTTISAPGQAAAATPQAGVAPAQPAAPLSLADQIKALPQGRVYGEHNQSPRVILRVLRPVKVVVLGPASRLFINRTLQPGDSYRVPDMVGMTLTTEDGSAVALELDGQLMGLAGTSKQIVEGQSLDPQAVVDHFNHAPKP